MKKSTNNLPLLAVLFGLAATPAFSQLPFQDGFESGSFNSTYWVPKPGTPSGLVTVAGTTPGGCVPFNHAGNYGAGLATSVDVSGTTTINGLWLKLNLAAYQNQDVRLSFWIKDAGDVTNDEDALYFSNDGGTSWSSQTFPFRVSQYTDDWGQFPPINIGAVFYDKAFTSNCVIRFSQRGSRDFNCTGNTQGYVIDDVLVQVNPVEYATLPFSDDFEGAGLSNYWSNSNPIYDGHTIYKNNSPEWKSRPDGVVEAVSSFNGVNFDAISGTKVLALGRRFDALDNSYYTGVAADLHLNLQGQTNPELSFWIKDLGNYFNQNLEEIGIFFSDDGGLNFTNKPVVDFRFNEWTDNLWGKMPPIPIRQLAAVYNKNLTSKFVIRFQALFNRDFNPSGSAQGILLDNVEVKEPSYQYATLPYCEDFETGTEVLEKYWHQANPYINGQTVTDVSWVRPEGLVDVTSAANGYTFQAHSPTKVLAMGTRTVLTLTDYAANAVDFRVKLAGKTGIGFSFWMRDFADASDDNDAVFFSNNGGQTFQKAILLNPGSASDVWHKVEIKNLEQICVGFNPPMNLTDQFVIRIQERGKGTFVAGNGGFIIDDACVSDATTSNKEIEQEASLKLFPNPTSGTFTLSFSEKTPLRITIFNALGQPVAQRDAPTREEAFDMSGKGVFIVQTDFGGGRSAVRRVVVQ